MSSCEENENSGDWAKLPDLVLTKIFLCLPHQDRFAASLVCRHWERNFHNGSLWKKMEFRFSSEQLADTKARTKALKFLNRHGSYLKILDVVQYDKDVPHMIEFFQELKSKEPQLSELRLLTTFAKYSTLEIVDSVAEFLKSQNKLRNFKLEGNFETQLLESAVFNCEDSIEVLEVSCINLDQKDRQNFMNIISSLKNLKYLSMRHYCIDENNLENVPENTFSKLELLELDCRYYDDPSHALSAETWKMVKKIFRNIKVHYHIDMTELSEIYDVLPEPIPLASLGLSFIGNDPSYPELVQYICDMSQNALEDLCLSGRGHTIPESSLDAMAECLKKLPGLKSLAVIPAE